MAPRPTSHRLFPVFDGRRYGYAGPSGEVVIPHRFTKIAGWGGEERFYEGLAVAYQEGKAGFIDPTGAWAIEPRWDLARPFSEGRAAVATFKPQVRWRMIDRQGRRIGPAAGWAELSAVVDGRAFAKETIGGPAALIDPEGAPLVTGYGGGSAFSEGLAAAQDPAGSWGFIDREGRWVIDPRFAAVLPFSEGLAATRTAEGDVAYLDPAGVERCRFPIRYLELYSFSEGLVRMPAPTMSLAKAYHDRDGALRIPASRGNLGDFSVGRALHGAGGYGFIDPSGALVIEPRYALADPFRDGLARAVPDGRKPGSWVYLDPEGRVAIEAR